MSGDVCVVGAYHAGGGGSEVGVAYIYKRDVTSSWSRVANLVNETESQNDYFGSSVDIDGDIVVVGSKGYGTDNDVGAVFVYNHDGDGFWTLAQRIDAMVQADNAHFGQAVAVQSRNIMASHDQNTALPVFMIELPSLVEEETSSSILTGSVHELKPSEGEAQIADFDGNFMIVGAPLYESAYIFELVDDSWIEVAKLIPSDGTRGEYFGCSVAISGQTAVVGTCAAELAGYIGQGDAYVFAKYPDGMWFQEAKLGPEDGDVQTFTFSPTISSTTSSPIVCAAIELNLCCKCNHLSHFFCLS